MSIKGHTNILFQQSLGFLAIIALSWLDECLGLSSLVFGDQPYFPEFHISALTMLFVLGIWLLVAGSTRRVVERMRYLEGFMRVCSWCRRVEYRGDWIRLEEFMQQGFDTPTTHGICDECLHKVTAAHERRMHAQTSHGPQPCG